MINRDAVRFVYGTDVYGIDNHKIGTAGQVYLDNGTGSPAWVAVRTGLFGRKESFVPLQDATLADGRLEVPFGKDQIKHAPRVDEDGELSPADEDELYRYYESLDTGRHDGDQTHDGDQAHDSDTGPDRVRDRELDETTGPDDAMTRSEEQLVVTGTRTEQTGRARLRKYVVTEEKQVTVPVSREEVRLEQEPAGGTDQARPVAPESGSTGRGEEPSMTLWAEEPVVTTRSVPVERVRMRKETVTGQETVSGDVRKERIELEDETGR